MKTLAPLPVPEAARGLAILRPLRPPIGKSEMVADLPDDSLRRAVERLSAAVVSEDAVALEFVARHGANVRYDHTARAWFVWDGARWKRDGTGLAFSWVGRCAESWRLKICRAPASLRGGPASARGSRNTLRATNPLASRRMRGTATHISSARRPALSIFARAF